MSSKGNYGEKLLLTGLIVIFALTGIFSLSIVDNLPFLEVKKLEIISNNKKLAVLARKIINKEANNNILLLKLKQHIIAEELRKKSHFQIENLEIIKLNFLNRSVILHLIINKPLIRFNKDLCLAENGRIFKTNLCSNAVLIDKTYLWKEGQIYNLTPMVERLIKNFAIKAIKVNEYSFTVKGNLISLYIPKEEINIKSIKEINSQICNIFNSPKTFVAINLGGKKANYIKIIKERSNE
jgi:hypothetical protein